VVSVISIFGCVQNKFRNKPYVTCPVYFLNLQNLSKCNVGCITNFVRFIITRESPVFILEIVSQRRQPVKHVAQ
jgi:hypothetical protein